MKSLSFIVITGVGATLVADTWALLRRRLFGTPLPNFAMVGRWIGWMVRGRFRHERIAATPAVKGEQAIGWAAHYAIGVAFAGLLVVWQGAQPTLASALRSRWVTSSWLISKLKNRTGRRFSTAA